MSRWVKDEQILRDIMECSENDENVPLQAQKLSEELDTNKSGMARHQLLLELFPNYKK